MGFLALWRLEKANFSKAKEIAFSWHQITLKQFLRFWLLKKRIFRIWKNRFFVVPKQPCTNFQCYDAPKKRIFQIGKKSLFHCAKTNWREILASWCPENTNFPNAKQITFSWRQSKLEAIFSDLTSWKSEFTKSERNRFFMESKFFWRDYQRFGAIRMRIFRIRKKSLFHDAKITLTRILVFWCLEKLTPCFDAMKKRVFRIRRKSLFHGAKKLWRDFQLFGALKKCNFTNVKEIAFSWRYSNLHAILCVLPPS